MNSKNLSKIQFIYFDVGGVAMLDFSKTNKWHEMMHNLEIPERVMPMFTEVFKEHEPQICVGERLKIFVEDATKKLGIKFPKDYSMLEDFVSRFERNEFILKLIEKLSKDFKLGLLTNQYPDMLNMIFERDLIPKGKWDVIIDSSIEKVSKPDPQIYILSEKRAYVPPESILFIDNKAKLLEIPRQRGWKTFEYDPSTPYESTTNLEKFIVELTM